MLTLLDGLLTFPVASRVLEGELAFEFVVCFAATFLGAFDEAIGFFGGILTNKYGFVLMLGTRQNLLSLLCRFFCQIATKGGYLTNWTALDWDELNIFARFLKFYLVCLSSNYLTLVFLQKIWKKGQIL